jgi:hypothetical protein
MCESALSHTTCPHTIDITLHPSCLGTSSGMALRAVRALLNSGTAEGAASPGVQQRTLCMGILSMRSVGEGGEAFSDLLADGAELAEPELQSWREIGSVEAAAEVLGTLRAMDHESDEGSMRSMIISLQLLDPAGHVPPPMLHLVEMGGEGGDRGL